MQSTFAAADSTVRVGTSAELAAALKRAVGGEVILLAPGSYGAFRIEDLQFGSPVVLASADPSARAVFAELLIRDVAGLVVSGIDLTLDPAVNSPFVVGWSEDVHLEHLRVTGAGAAASTLKTAALLMRDSTDVSIVGSSFHGVRYGVAHGSNEGFLVASNSFQDIRVDGIRGGNSSHVRVYGNFLTNLFPLNVVSDGDHVDAIQFWTKNGLTETHDVAIENNIYVRGSGRPVQGIFMNDESGLGYSRVTISDNVVIGSLYHGLTVAGATDLVSTNNTVFGAPGQYSWIRYSSSTNVTSEDNVAERYNHGSLTAFTSSGDVSMPTPLDGGAALLAGLERLRAEPVTPTTRTAEFGGEGDDALVGGGGNDTLVGGAGDDTIQGGRGDDRLEGGPGADVFVFRPGFGHDVLVDYDRGTDVLDFLAFTVAGIEHVIDWSTGVGKIVFETGDTILLGGVQATTWVNPFDPFGGP